MQSSYFVPNKDSFRLTKENKLIEKEISDTYKMRSFYFAPNNGSFKLTKTNEPINEEILDATQVEELANNVKDFNKRNLLKILGVAGLGIAGTTLFPKKADALILGGTPTSSVVGVKNASNTRINPATEETLGTVLKKTDLTFEAGSLDVKVTSLPPSSFSDSAGVDKKGLVNAARNVQVDVLSSALPSSASTETTLQTISFGSTKFALKLTTVGSIDYIGEAAVGTATSAASWRAKKVDSTTGIVITWADGNANFDNSATDLTVLTYS